MEYHVWFFFTLVFTFSPYSYSIEKVTKIKSIHLSKSYFVQLSLIGLLRSRLLNFCCCWNDPCWNDVLLKRRLLNRQFVEKSFDENDLLNGRCLIVVCWGVSVPHRIHCTVFLKEFNMIKMKIHEILNCKKKFFNYIKIWRGEVIFKSRDS